MSDDNLSTSFWEKKKEKHSKFHVIVPFNIFGENMNPLNIYYHDDHGTI